MPKATVLAFKNNKNSFCIILKLLYIYFLRPGVSGRREPSVLQGMQLIRRPRGPHSVLCRGDTGVMKVIGRCLPMSVLLSMWGSLPRGSMSGPLVLRECLLQGQMQGGKEGWREAGTSCMLCLGIGFVSAFAGVLDTYNRPVL